MVALGSVQATAQDSGEGRNPPVGGQQGTGVARPQHAAGPNTGKTVDAVKRFSGGPISIINPAKNTATLSYTLGGDAFTISPGYGQNFHDDRVWVIRFSPGTNRDDVVQYWLHTGLYTFTNTDHGWELYRSKSP